MKVKTLEEFKDFIKNNLGEDYEVLSDFYKNTRTILELKHKTCNTNYTVIAYNILKDKPTKCPKCFGHKSFSFEEIKEKFKNFNNGEYEVISGIYKNNKSILTFKHVLCGTVFDGEVNRILNGIKKCPNCKSCKKKTTDIFKDEIKNLVGDEYTLMSEYINRKTKVTIKHNICGHSFDIFPYNFIKKQNKCIYCDKNNRKNTDIFKEEIKNLVGDEYTLMSEYINNSTHVKMKHNLCGKIYSVLPSNFSLGSRCPDCVKEKKRLTHDEYLKRVKKEVDNEYTILEKYLDYNTPILTKHNKCGNIWKISPTHLLHGERCPRCRNNYIGEERIAKWLDKHDIEYERGYPFKDLYDKSKHHPLRFDFKLAYDDGSLLLIEYDGEQHEKEWIYGSLEDRKRKDQLKNKYCEKNNHELLRINYRNFNNIEIILEEFFKDLL